MPNWAWSRIQKNPVDPPTISMNSEIVEREGKREREGKKDREREIEKER